MVFSKPRYARYAIDLSHPAIRYAIAAAITVSDRYAATFPNNGPCLLLTLPQFLKAAKRVVRIQNPSIKFAIDSQKH